MAADLVDYLRDKLAHADDPVCTCQWVDITLTGDEYQRDMLNTADCPQHPDRHVGDIRQGAPRSHRRWPR